jgi:protein SCO1/2
MSRLTSRGRGRLAAASVLFLALLVPLSLAGWGRLRVWARQPLTDFGAAPAFTLTDQFGQAVHSDEFGSKVVVANFIYTTCTDVCPALSGQMLNLQKALQAEGLLGNEVQLLSFTVDPARDTPDVLRAYAERFHAHPQAWRFLTGPEDRLIPLIVEGLHLGVQALPPTPAPRASEGDHDEHASYAVMHSGRFVLIDRQGHIRAFIDSRELEPARMMQDIRALLRD